MSIKNKHNKLFFNQFSDLINQTERAIKYYTSNNQDKLSFNLIFKLKVFKKALSVISDHPYKITSGKDLIKYPGIGNGVAKRIDQIIKNGKIDDEFNNIPVDWVDTTKYNYIEEDKKINVNTQPGGGLKIKETDLPEPELKTPSFYSSIPVKTETNSTQVQTGKDKEMNDSISKNEIIIGLIKHNQELTNKYLEVCQNEAKLYQEISNLKIYKALYLQNQYKNEEIIEKLKLE